MKIRKSKKIPPLKTGVFCVLIILIILALWNMLRKSRIQDEEFLAPAIVVRPRLGRIEKSLGLSGRVETGRLITVVPRVAGTLEILDADPGREVAAGDILAQVDPEPYNLTFLQAQAAYLTAQSTFHRVENLYNNQAASRQQYEEARTAHEAAKSQFELARMNRDYTHIRSPIDGVVLIRHAVQGALAAPGTPLVTLGDLEDLRVKAAVPEIHYRFFAGHWKDMTVRMSAAALGEEVFILKPLSLAPYVSPENRSFIVEYTVPQGSSRGLRPGMFVSMSFIMEFRDNVYSLPFRTLGSGNRLWYVDEDSKARYVEFKPEFFNDTEFVIPEAHAERRFILEGQHFISPGQKINILSGAEAVSP
jgi:RND family efflux transporter MFP subunit